MQFQRFSLTLQGEKICAFCRCALLYSGVYLLYLRIPVSADGRRDMLNAKQTFAGFEKMLSVLPSILTVLINLVLGSAHMIILLRLKEGGAGTMMMSVALPVWAVVCCVLSGLIGFVLNEQNARRFLQVSATLFFTAFTGLIFFNSNYFQLFWLFVIGFGSATFCAPLQIFMKKLETGQRGGLVRAAAMYSASWSLGMAVGPFLFAMLSAVAGEQAWRVAYIMDAVLMVPVFFIPMIAERLAARRNRSVQAVVTDTAEVAAADDFSGRPDMAPAGWALIIASFTLVMGLRTILPDQGRDAGYSEVQISLLVSVLYFCHSVTSMAMIRSREWMYKAGVVTVLSIGAVLGLLGYIFLFRSIGCLFFCTVLLGIHSGMAGFCLVFYALAHPVKAAKYTAINEVVVGASNMLSPLLLVGGLIWLTGLNWSPFAAMILIVTGSLIYFLLRLRRS